MITPEIRRKLDEMNRLTSTATPSFFYVGGNKYEVKDIKYEVNYNTTVQDPLGAANTSMLNFVNNTLLNERVKMKLNNQSYMVKEFNVKLGRPFSTPVLDKEKEYWIPFHGRLKIREFCFKESEIKDFNLLIRAWQGFRDAEFEFLLNQGVSELELLLSDIDLSELEPKLADEKDVLDQTSKIKHKYYTICETSWNVDELKDAYERIMSEHIDSVLWSKKRYQEKTDLDKVIKAINRNIKNSKSHKCPIPNTEILTLKSYKEKAIKRKWFLNEGFKKQLEKIKNDIVISIRKELAINIKAIELLKRWITPEEYQELLINNHLSVKSKYYEGRYFRLHKEPREQTGLYTKDGKYIERMCIVCEIGLPSADILLSKYLMIKFDEEQFIRKADHQYQRYTWEYVRPRKEDEPSSRSSRYRSSGFLYGNDYGNDRYDRYGYPYPAYPEPRIGARHEETESRQTAELTTELTTEQTERRQLYIRQPADTFATSIDIMAVDDTVNRYGGGDFDAVNNELSNWQMNMAALNDLACINRGFSREYKLEYNHPSHFTAHRQMGERGKDEREIFRGTIYRHLSRNEHLQVAIYFNESKKPLQIRMYSAPSNDGSNLKCVTIGADGKDQDIIKALIGHQLTADQFVTAYKARMLERTKTAWAGTFMPIFYNKLTNKT